VRDFRQEVAVTNRTVVGALARSDPTFKQDLAMTQVYHEVPTFDREISMEEDDEGGIPRQRQTQYFLVEMDSLTCAEYVIKVLGKQESDVAVLNMANQFHPGGGYLNGALAQEEALCRRSSLFAHLAQRGGSFYPLDDLGGIWSPGVRVFRDEDDKDCEFWDENNKRRFKVGIISVAALNSPRLTEDCQDYFYPNDKRITLHKIDAILSIAVVNQVKHLVLGAFGCGAFCNPPLMMARMFRERLSSSKYKGKFETVFISILERAGSRNTEPWRYVFSDMLSQAPDGTSQE